MSLFKISFSGGQKQKQQQQKKNYWIEGHHFYSFWCETLKTLIHMTILSTTVGKNPLGEMEQPS